MLTILTSLKHLFHFLWNFFHHLKICLDLHINEQNFLLRVNRIQGLAVRIFDFKEAVQFTICERGALGHQVILEFSYNFPKRNTLGDFKQTVC